MFVKLLSYLCWFYVETSSQLGFLHFLEWNSGNQTQIHVQTLFLQNIVVFSINCKFPHKMSLLFAISQIFIILSFLIYKCYRKHFHINANFKKNILFLWRRILWCKLSIFNEKFYADILMSIKSYWNKYNLMLYQWIPLFINFLTFLSTNLNCIQLPLTQFLNYSKMLYYG